MSKIFTPLLESRYIISYLQKEEALHVEIKSEDIYTFISTCKENDFSYMLDITAIDYLNYPKTPSARFELIYLIRHKNFLYHIKINAFTPTCKVDSIVSLYESANWLERETYDQYGIEFLNHPNLKRILNHHQFVGHPLQKDYSITKGQHCLNSESLMDEMSQQLFDKGISSSNTECKIDEDLMFLNIGPAHPASHGTIRTLVALDGENIISAVSEIGYLHRGFEKSCENHTYNQIVPYTDRLNYCSAITNNVGFVKTIEEMLNLEITPRAKMIRIFLMELSRIMDHLVCLAAMLVDMGALTNYWYLYNPREDIYTFLSKLTGARLTNSYMRVGGMSHDLYEGYEADLEVILKNVKSGVDQALSLIAHNRIFHDRTQDVAKVSANEALRYAFSGPNLRASGVNYDMRIIKPYYGYNEFDFDVVLGSHGDIYDRMMVRFEEINQSISIINQLKNNIPDGEININNRAVTLPKKHEVYNSIEGVMNHFKLTFEGVLVKSMQHYSSIEATNGELGFFVVSDNSGTPYKLKVRSPSFLAMSAYPKIIENLQIADAVLALGSINIIAGEMDR